MRSTIIALVKYFGKLIIGLLGFIVISQIVRKMDSSIFKSTAKPKIIEKSDVKVW